MDQQITKELIAAALHGREYGDVQTVPGAIAEQAKAVGFVIVYGESDDLMEFRGAFTEEISAYEGTKALVDAEGVIERPRSLDERDDSATERYLQRKKIAATIEAIWAQGGCSWSYHTALPHAIFDIMEEGNVYCRGIVIAVADLPRAYDWQKIAADRLEKIQSMSEFLDNLAMTIGIQKPKTPGEGVGAVQDLITAIQVLQWKENRNTEAIDELRRVVDEADKYLDTNKLTNIANGSSLHRAFKDVLLNTIPIKSPLLEMMHQEGVALKETAEATCTWRQPGGTELVDTYLYEAECDGSTVNMDGPPDTTDMERCYRCGRKIAAA